LWSIVPSASYGLQIAANALPLDAGQTILALEDQFPSHIYPWQHKVRSVEGSEFILIPTPDNYDWTAALLERIDGRTAIVAVPHVHWTNGAKLDLPRIREALDQVSGALVLDLTQSLGAMPFDTAVIRPDFAVAATYKWLMGPYSLGCLYVDPKWHRAEPLEHNWMNREGSEDFTGLTRYRDGFQPGARRFDMGEKSNPAQLMGASVALSQILDWGVDNIAQTLAAKTGYIAHSLSSSGANKVRILPDPLRAPHYLGLEFSDGVPDGLSARLAEQNIFISVRGASVRVTPHLYTTDADIDRFVKAMT